MARDRFLTNATDDLPETETKRHAPTIQDLYLLPNQGAEAVVSGSRDGCIRAVLRLNAARRSLTSLGDFLAEIFEVTK